jgi:hypothetical protein
MRRVGTREEVIRIRRGEKSRRVAIPSRGAPAGARPHARLSCHDTPKRSLSQTNRLLKP